MAYSTSFPPSLVTQAMTYTGGPRIWVYTTTDAIATMDTTGYITNGGNLGMRVGDLLMVYISGAPGSITVVTARVVSVSSTAPGAVDLGDFTVVGSNTNTD